MYGSSFEVIFEILLCFAFSIKGSRVSVFAWIVAAVTFHRIFKTFSNCFHKLINVVAIKLFQNLVFLLLKLPQNDIKTAKNTVA